MKTINCLLVDDEPLARVQLRGLLEPEPGVRIAGEAGRMHEALELTARLKPDLLFLDVSMIGGGGFEILAALPDPPAVVFVTAHDQHAVRAFEVNAVEYLLKPVDAERLKVSLERVRNRSEAVPQPLEEDDMALLPLGASGHFVPVREILYIQADGHYSRVVLADGKHHLIRLAFHSWAERLPTAMFWQLGRGLIINRSRITSCSHATRSSELRFEGGAAPLVLGTAASKRLRALLPGSPHAPRTPAQLCQFPDDA